MTPRKRSAFLALCWLFLVPAALTAQAAPGGPGELPTWTDAGKDGIGTAATAQSKVWFTLQGGILTEVYYPRVDMADVRGLEFAVSDGNRTWIESRDMQHAIERIDDHALLFRQTSTEPAAASPSPRRTPPTPAQHAAHGRDVHGPAGDRCTCSTTRR